MAYEKTWHRDYAAESLKRAETSRWTQDANLEWTQLALECAQVVQLARQVGEELGNEKSLGSPTPFSRRSKLTHKRTPTAGVTGELRRLRPTTLRSHYWSDSAPRER